MGLEIPFWNRDQSDLSVAVFESVARLAEGPVRDNAAAMDKTGDFPRELYRLLGETGCLAPRLPEALAGIGLGTFDYCKIIFMMAAESPAMGNAVVSAGIAANYLYSFGAGRFDEVLQAYADGSMIPAMALTEASAGSDLRSLRTTATPVDGGYHLTGEKAWITKGAVCDRVMVLARLADQQRREDDLVGLLVNPATEGFERGKVEDLMGMRGLAVAGLSFNDMFVPESQVVGVPGEGFEQTVKALSFGRILVASLALGIARGALRRAADYSLERRQFGKRIWDFQNTKFQIGELSARVLSAESLIARACEEYDAGRDPVAEASGAKLLASDLAMEASTYAVQVYGAIGYSREFDVERFMRDAKVTQIYEGTNEIQRHLLARHLITT